MKRGSEEIKCQTLVKKGCINQENSRIKENEIKDTFGTTLTRETNYKKGTSQYSGSARWPPSTQQSRKAGKKDNSTAKTPYKQSVK